MVRIKHKGSFKKTEKFLEGAAKADYIKRLDRYGREGVNALSSATPMDSGVTADSWSYQIHESKGFYGITWTNSNAVDGIPIVILIQYGHGTGTGGYVQGRDFINPVIQPLFDRMADDIWKEVIL